ncbi:MAG: hypothetical protein CVU57_23590 [Deltaproteobacteria bacterium HGW-Deltaproteobacteria-15]|jgi:hypothetical protein|nr:MAG: hypothetical protein CVU57_23590 [Deltaproteobacteria bacterium HGW-Deltaproteobacteria-15]
MDALQTKRSTAGKVQLFSSFFSGLQNAYGTYDPVSGRSWQVKKLVTEKTILDHLRGKSPYGVYLLVEGRTRAIVTDFDLADYSPPHEFMSRAKHYGLPAYIEASKSKGFHAWIFFGQEGAKASKARLVVKNILEEIGYSDTEVFPKQDFLDQRACFGNFINAPLFGGLVPMKKTVFVDPGTFDPFPDQWDFLESVQRANEHLLDEIIEMNGLRSANEGGLKPKNDTTEQRTSGHSLPPCAQRILTNGVSHFQRVSCFRLAVHFKRMGLPYDITVAALKTWALKNTPPNGKGVIQDSEILKQTSCAYDHGYKGYGCNDPAIKPFCDPNCPVNEWRKQR